jgi:hypothetical protein
VAQHSIPAEAPKPRRPILVADKSFIGETGSIPPTTLFAPCSTGTFKVSFYIEQSNTAGGFGPEAFLSWAGDFDSYFTQVNGGKIATGSAAANTGELTIRGAAGQPIQLQTTMNPAEQGTYNMYVVMEKL